MIFVFSGPNSIAFAIERLQIEENRFAGSLIPITLFHYLKSIEYNIPPIFLFDVLQI